MPTPSHYDEIIDHFGQLDTAEQFRILEDLMSLLHKRVMAQPPQPRHRIMELRGLGKEIWEGIDAQEYVNQERASWNG